MLKISKVGKIRVPTNTAVWMCSQYRLKLYNLLIDKIIHFVASCYILVPVKKIWTVYNKLFVLEYLCNIMSIFFILETQKLTQQIRVTLFCP